MTTNAEPEHGPDDTETVRLGDSFRAFTFDDFPHPLRAHDVPALIAKDIG
jgi:hypothetical protein